MMAPLGTLFATTTLTWKRIAPCSASRNQTLATKSRKSIEHRMWVDISQLCQLCCSQLWPMHVQKDFVQWLVQDFVQWSFRICCSKSFSKKVRAIQLNFSCCHFDSNTSSNSKLRIERIPREHYRLLFKISNWSSIPRPHACAKTEFRPSDRNLK